MAWNGRNKTTKNNERPCGLEGQDRKYMEQTRHMEEEYTSNSTF